VVTGGGINYQWNPVACVYLSEMSYGIKKTKQALFVMGFLEIGSRKLFAWAGFEPDPHDLFPPEKLEFQA
jgi:hypothetical protein